MKQLIFIGIGVLLLWCTTARAQPEINLTGTIKSGQNQVALIDNEVYYIGDETSGCTIKEINKQGITVVQNGKSRRILVGNGKSDNTLSSNIPYSIGSEKSIKSYLPIISVILIIIGLIANFVGGIWTLIVSFRVSIAWGLCCIFIPLGELIFLILNWKEASKPFGLSMLGFIISVAAVFISPEFLLSL